jgi:hypothetical protein
VEKAVMLGELNEIRLIWLRVVWLARRWGNEL